MIYKILCGSKYKALNNFFGVRNSVHFLVISALAQIVSISLQFLHKSNLTVNHGAFHETQFKYLVTWPTFTARSLPRNADPSFLEVCLLTYLLNQHIRQCIRSETKASIYGVVTNASLFARIRWTWMESYGGWCPAVDHRTCLTRLYHHGTSCLDTSILITAAYVFLHIQRLCTRPYILFFYRAGLTAPAAISLLAQNYNIINNYY